jgi:hypothetical protein
MVPQGELLNVNIALTAVVSMLWSVSDTIQLNSSLSCSPTVQAVLRIGRWVGSPLLLIILVPFPSSSRFPSDMQFFFFCRWQNFNKILLVEEDAETVHFLYD